MATQTQAPRAAALTFKGSIKSFDVEDPVNIWVHRPIQLAIARVLLPLGFTANQVTLLALIAGLGAAAAIVVGTRDSLLLAGALLFASAILDGVDGMLARARGVASPFGHVLDGAADSIVKLATIWAGAYHLSHTIGVVPAVLLALAAHVATEHHVMVYDFYLTHFLRLGVRSRSGGGVIERGEQMIDELRAEPGKQLQLLLMRAYVWQLRNRDRFVHRLNPRAATEYDALQPDAERAERYQRHHRWPMRLTSWLGNAPHMDLFALCVAIGRIEVYFLLRIFAFTALAIAQTAWHRRVTEGFLAEETGHVRDAVAGVGSFLGQGLAGLRLELILAGIVFVTGLWYVPALLGGFMADDHAFLMTLHELPAMFWHEVNLFGLVYGPEHVEMLRQNGIAPWWTSPDFVINFWRPIPSLTHYLDFQLWGYEAFRSHAVNVAIYLVTIVLVHRLFTQLSPEKPGLALLSTAIFALDECHALTVQWIANRSELIGTAFMIASLLAFLRYKESGRRSLGVVSILAFVVALLSRETAIAIPLFLLAHEIAMPEGGASPLTRATFLRELWRRARPRLWVIVPMIACVLVFLAGYFLTGHGARSAYYINPLRAPDQFALHLLPGTFLNSALLVTGLPIHLLGHTPIADYPLIAAALFVVVAGFWYLAFRWLRGEPLFRFFILWLVVMSLLFTAGYPDPRYLFVPSIAFAWIVARMIEFAWERRSGARARAYTWAFGTLLVLHFGVAPALGQASLQVVKSFDEDYATLRTSLERHVPYAALPEEGMNVFFLDWHQPETNILSGLYLRRVLPTGADDYSHHMDDEHLSVIERQAIGFGSDRVHYYILSMMSGDEIVEVVSDHEIDIESPDGTYFSTMYEELYTTRTRFEVGESFDAGAFVATVQEVDEDGQIARARFRFDEPLSSPRNLFLRFDGEQFVPAALGGLDPGRYTRP